MGIFDNIKQSAEEGVDAAKQAVSNAGPDSGEMPETSNAEHGLGVEATPELSEEGQTPDSANGAGAPE